MYNLHVHVVTLQLKNLKNSKIVHRAIIGIEAGLGVTNWYLIPQRLLHLTS